MFCNGLICLKKYKVKQFSSKVTSFVLLDKIIIVVFWTDAKRLVLNRVLDFYDIFVEENT